ncbi:YtxH domain-containing protein [Pedobacter cryoconitis]|uniref:YtxH-like protein n=1 Tax=Pedobacter cryoconitis TaxID=188932 RepID=A0A327RUV3_9SPHI|nr:YtxH domain-containing protein [Pedobacter cryoconitis]RAJ19812.1 YtxH-like protein [Pedobacter cryoconitis]
MSYKKLIKSVIHAHQDNSLSAFALVAGLAAGAAIAVLFAPRSGSKSRKLLLEKLNLTQKQEPHHELKDRLLTDLRETTRKHADHLQGPEKKRKDPTEIKVPSAGTTAWKNKSVTERSSKVVK